MGKTASASGPVDIRIQLAAALPTQLVDALIAAYNELLDNYRHGKWKPGELEAGHFSEVAYRILEHMSSTPATHTPLGRPIPRIVDKLRALENLGTHVNDSVRFHIPRALVMMVDVRNRRGIGHPAGEVSANPADAALLVGTSTWVLCELIRLTFSCSADEAQVLVNSLVQRRVPIVEDFDGFLKILKPELKLSEKIMVLLYQRSAEGALNTELAKWLKLRDTSNLYKSLADLEKRGMIHRMDGRNWITTAGAKWVEVSDALR